MTMTTEKPSSLLGNDKADIDTIKAEFLALLGDPGEGQDNPQVEALTAFMNQDFHTVRFNLATPTTCAPC